MTHYASVWRRFGRMQCLDIHVKREEQSNNNKQAKYAVSLGYSSILRWWYLFFRNVGELLADYTASHIQRKYRCNAQKQ
jgi:hypothetical protein